MSRFFTGIIVTYAYICVSINSSMARATPSLSMECSPTTLHPQVENPQLRYGTSVPSIVGAESLD